MKKLLITLSILSAAANHCLAQSFRIDTVTLKTKTLVESATFFDGYIYCLDKQGGIFKINLLSGQSEDISTDGRVFQHILNLDGKLIALQEDWESRRHNRIKYQYNGKKFRKIGKISRGSLGRNLYEDDKFEVTSSCSGEWGGTVYFKDKKTRRKYECSATCPTTVSKVGEAYVVTATSSHMVGYTQIVQIDNPTMLTPLKKRSRRNIGSYESRSTKGAVVLADSVGIMTVASFVYMNELYYITTKDYNFWGNEKSATYLSKIQDGKFESIEKIWDGLLWRSDYSREVPYNNGYMLALDDENTKEPLIFSISENNITIFKFERE